MTDFSEMLSMAGSNLPAGINKDRLDKIYAGLVERGVSEEDIPVVMSYILEESGADPFRKDRYGIGLLDGTAVEDNMFEDDEDKILSQQLDSIVAGVYDGSVDTFVPLGDTVYGNALQRRYADGGELPSEEYVFPYYPSRTDEAVLRYFKGSPYSMPLTEVGADGKERIVGMDDITDSVVTGTDAYLYDDAFMKSRTVYQDTDGKYIMVDNNVLPKLKSELIGREVSFEDLQKEMPSMSYLGGNDYRLRTAMLIPGLFDAVKKKADSYGLNPNLILNRLIREGFIDSVAREFNESDDKKHFFTDGHIWEGSRSGFSEFGFDDVGANLMNKLYSLKDPTAEWYWDDDIAPENEKGRQLKYVPIVKDLNSALELLSAELAYRKNVLQKRGIPEEDLDIYTNAAYNAGLYHPMLNDRERILGKYNIPDWYGKARARAFGGNLYDGLSGTSQMQRGPIYDPKGLMVTPAPVRTMDVAVTDMAHVQPQAVVVSSGQEVGPIKGFSYSRPVNLKQTLLKSLGEVYSVPDASAINPTIKSDKAVYTPDREYNEALALGSSENSAIAKALANLPKDEKDIKELQGMLLDSGYYDLSNITPKITAKTTDEIKALQQMLVDNGYDLGKYGVDGKIGSFTRNAYAQYMKEHPDEAIRQTIIDGNFGKASKAAYRKYLAATHKNNLEDTQITPPVRENDIPLPKVDNGLGDIRTYPEFLYQTGGSGAMNRVLNLGSVGRNLVNGMLNPGGSNATLSPGAKRQMYGASLQQKEDKGTYGISDAEHIKLGGMADDSGKEFRDTGSTTKDLIAQAAKAPYHNVFGQSSSTYDPETGTFFPNGDGYTYNNVWKDSSKVGKVMKDGEGDADLITALKIMKEAYNSGIGLKASIENGASMRGVNVKPSKSVRISQKQQNRWEKQYRRYVKDEKYRKRINKMLEKYGF